MPGIGYAVEDGVDAVEDGENGGSDVHRSDPEEATVAAHGVLERAYEVGDFFRLAPALSDKLAREPGEHQDACVAAVERLFRDVMICVLAAGEGRLETLLDVRPALRVLAAFLDTPTDTSRLVRTTGRVKLFVVRCPDTDAVIVDDMEWARVN